MKNKIIEASYKGKVKLINLYKIELCKLTEDQKVKAKDFNATHCFRMKDIKDLPKYIKEALTSEGFKYIKIGHTSYKSSTWGAREE